VPSGDTGEAVTLLGDTNTLAPLVWPRTVARGADGALRIGGVSLVDVAERCGTPAYLFDEHDFRSRCAEFRTAFHDFEVYYAAKAFLCKAVARLVRRAGLGLDVCTGGELAVALATGFPADRIVLHGNNKTDQELDEAVRCGVGRVVVDSVAEIDRLAAAASRYGRRPRVLVRVTVGATSDAHPHNATAHDDQKFGIPLRGGAALAAVRLVRRDAALRLCGLHTHLGSQLVDHSVYEVAIRRLAALCASAGPGTALPELSLGGGFAIAYTAADRPAPAARLARRLRRSAAAAFHDHGIPVPRLAIEPGRAIAGPAGCTLYRVGTVKPVDGLRTYVSVDGGVSDNLRPALFGTRYSVTLVGRASTAAPILVRVVGRHCDAGDVVVHDGYLPADVQPGDLLAVAATGAYCRNWSNNFNHTPRPPVIALADGAARTVVRRETLDDLLRLDVG
jgi:diaminopimelate decarboxylase